LDAAQKCANAKFVKLVVFLSLGKPLQFRSIILEEMLAYDLRAKNRQPTAVA